jgi:PucR family transcriptional regulator, purine catabolism regulatory protein
MLPLGDLIRDLDVRLVAGEAGVENAVRWVHISELEDPTPWLSGGELLLTTGMRLLEPEEQRAFVRLLAGHGLAGMGLGTGFAHREVPPALRDEASQLGFPLVEVPYEVPFIAVTEKAASHLVNEHYAVLQRALSAHERLERIVLSERGLDGVADALASLIGGPALIFDARGAELVRRTHRAPLSEETVEELRAELRRRIRDGARRGYAPGGELEGRALALPVVRTPPNGTAQPGDLPHAWLVAAKDGGALTEFDRLTLHQAVTIVALELLRRRVADDTERRLAGDVLDAIVSGELSGPDVARRLGPFGLSDRVAAIVLRSSEEGRAASGSGGGSIETALWSALREEAIPTLVASVGPLACALVPGASDEDLLALGQRVLNAADGELRGESRVGIGRAVPAVDARRSFHEARCALEALALGVAGTDGNGGAPEKPRLATYKDLGSFQLLLSLQDDEALRLFCDSILGPIEASEGPYGGELMRSLEAFIEENGQWERAARRLYCHRHTLRYRIRRVEELTGRNLSSARDRIEFWLALRGRQLVA